MDQCIFACVISTSSMCEDGCQAVKEPILGLETIVYESMYIHVSFHNVQLKLNELFKITTHTHHRGHFLGVSSNALHIHLYTYSHTRCPNDTCKHASIHYSYSNTSQ